MKTKVIVAVAGGSGSGKTTFAKLLCQQLGEERCQILSQDSYYIDRSKEFKGDGENINFDHPEALDFPLLQKHLSEIRQGQSIDVPVYDYSTHSRSHQPNRFEPKEVVIVDGILILVPEYLRPSFDHVVFVDAPEAERFQRRLRRDVSERGRTPEGVRKQFDRQVKPMHDQFVEPTKSFATQVINGLEPFDHAVSEFAGKILGAL